MTHELHAVLATLAELLGDGLRFLRTLCHSRTTSAAEILFLRKQLAYYQEHQVKPRRLTDGSRLSLVALLRLESGARCGQARYVHSVAPQGVQVVLALEVTRWPSAVAERHPADHCSHGKGECDLGRGTGRR